jgi:dTDP-4-dehydrorhamnose 3,5-epimerase
MKFTELEIPGLIHIERDLWGDSRGFFLEVFHEKKYAGGGIGKPFVQDNHSHSVRGVLRGLHCQRRQPQAKLISVLRGEIFDVAVDIRRGSPAFGKSVGLVLSDKNHAQLYVPEGCLHGFCVLSESADVLYKCTELYIPADEQGIIWNDPTFGIEWPLKDPVLSPKDAKLPRFSDIPADLLPVFTP